jgi:hypothetical protein
LSLLALFIIGTADWKPAHAAPELPRPASMLVVDQMTSDIGQVVVVQDLKRSVTCWEFPKGVSCMPNDWVQPQNPEETN